MNIFQKWDNIKDDPRTRAELTIVVNSFQSYMERCDGETRLAEVAQKMKAARSGLRRAGSGEVGYSHRLASSKEARREMICRAQKKLRAANFVRQR